MRANELKRIGGFLRIVLTAVLVFGCAESEAFTPQFLGARGRHHHHRLISSRSAPRTGGRGKLVNAGHKGKTPSSTRGCVRFILYSKTVGVGDANVFEDTMQKLMRTLEEDLPLQYEKPQDLSIFGDSVEFQDPVTTLRGKLLYRGMLFFTLMFFRVACKPSSSYFTVKAIDRPTRKTIRTVWETGAVTTWNGRELFISGVDIFTVGEDGRISRHDSAWDQTWEQVRGQVS